MMTLAGRPISSSRLRMASTASPSDAPCARLKEMVVAGNWPRWLIESGAVRVADAWRAPTAAPGRRRGRGRQIERRRAHRARRMQRAVGLQDHAVLVRLREDGRDDALAEGVVERVVDGRRRDAEARGGVAVDGEVGDEPLVLLVARHVRELRAAGCSRSTSFGTQVGELRGVRRPRARTGTGCG